MDLDIKKIEKEIGGFEDPYVYFKNLRNKIFSYNNGNHFARVILMQELCVKKMPKIIENMDEYTYKNISFIVESIWKEINRDIERDPILSDDKKMAWIYIKWLPYIIRYNISLKEIKCMLERCEDLIFKNIVKWQEFISKEREDISTLLEDLRQCESEEKIIVCTFLRRIIETILELQILNNKDSIKNKFKPLGVSSYYKFLRDENIDWKIKTLKDHQCVSGYNHYKYIVSKIWDSKRYLTKKIYNELLSDNIHQQFENFISFSSFNRASDIDSFKKYTNKKIRELDDLKHFLFELHTTLNNHLVSFERDELTVVVRNFEIEKNSLKEKYFKNDTNYKFEKIPNVNS